MLKEENETYREICLKCRRPNTNCFCKDIKPFDTRVHFVILMHPKEDRRQRTGTGRLAHLALQNSELIVGLDFTHNKRVNEIINDTDFQSFILYPNEKSLNISHSNAYQHISEQKQIAVFLIDSTWRCSNKMMKLSSNLAKLPTISFDFKKESQFKIKRQPKEYCLSTIEAIYTLLQEFDAHNLENVGNKKETLPETLKRMVDHQIACRSKSL